MNAISAYLVASQEVLRAEGGLFRKKLMVQSAYEQSQQAARRYVQASSSYELPFLATARDEAATEAQKRVTEFHAAENDINKALDRLDLARDSLTTFVPADALIDPALIETVRKRIP